MPPVFYKEDEILLLQGFLGCCGIGFLLLSDERNKMAFVFARSKPIFFCFSIKDNYKSSLKPPSHSKVCV